MNGLRAGQLLDTDRLTAISTSVVAVGTPVDGQRAVVFQEKNQGFTATLAYEQATGRLIHYTLDTPLVFARSDIRLLR